MQKINMLLILTLASLITLVSVIFVGIYISSLTPAQASYLHGMMGGGVMGGYPAAQTQTQSATAPYFFVAYVILVALIAIGAGGLLNFYSFSGARTRPTLAASHSTPGMVDVPASEASPYEAVLKTLNTDERKIIEILTNHGGKYLQKYIRSEAGLSRLQTHRVVSRLADRGIVKLEKTGNTNTVLMAEWLN